MNTVTRMVMPWEPAECCPYRLRFRGGTSVGNRQCFVIAPIGPEGSAVRRRSDQILSYVIRPVVEPLGYSAVRGDEMQRGGLITTQVLDRIIEDELVIADLTDQNPNVFYELAVRHMVRKPFVQLMANDQALPFDVQGMRTILIDVNDLDSVHSAMEQLHQAIEAMEQESEIVTPTSLALTLLNLRDSPDSAERSLSQIIQMLQTTTEIVQEIHDQTSAAAIGHTGDVEALRRLRQLVEKLTDRGVLPEADLHALLKYGNVSVQFERWVLDLIRRIEHRS